jgi:YYY domain-containing protein
MLSVVTKVPSTIAFNIATAMFPALAVCASYGLGYNITKRKLYGFLTAFFVCIVGYTSGFFQLVAYISHHQVLGFLPLTVTNIKEWLLWFDFWSAPWLVEGALVHYPYFSFLLGDLHTYAMSIPFQLMFITLIFALFQRKHLNYKIALSDTLLDIFVLGLCLGFFFILNTWEYPTYIIFTLLAFILLRIRPSIKGTFAVMTAIIGLSFILYLAYYILGGMSGFRGLGLVTVKTSLSQFLEFGALFLFATCSLLYLRSKREVLLGWRMILICSLILIATVLAAILLHFPLLIIVVPIGLLSLYFICKSKPKSEKEFVLLLILMSAALIFFCEFIYIDDALDGAWARFNTIMKVYHQLWVLFGISAVFALYYVLNNLGRKTKVIWIIILIVLVLVSLIHPIASTTSALSGRHTHWGLNRGTLDGMAYVEKIDKGDYDAIKWINREIKGSPAILETPGNPNLYSCRVSAFTGLPTVIGWGTWEIMWRFAWGEVEERIKDVATIYNTLDNSQAMELLGKYNVEYIYIGALERKTYESDGLQKFATESGNYDLIYDAEGVNIFRVRGINGKG